MRRGDAGRGVAQGAGVPVANEQQILKELVDFLAIPNLASDTPNIEKNAAAIQAMFAKRQVEARLLRVAGAPPLVVADLRAPARRRRSRSMRTTTGSRSILRSGPHRHGSR